MPLNNYGVLKGRPVEVRIGAGNTPHYQVRLVDGKIDFRIAINVMSNLSPSELEYVIIENFLHPVTSIVEKLPSGFTKLRNNPNSGALDYIRGNLFDRKLMRALPHSVPGYDNDLNEKIDRIIQRALADESAEIYAFGDPWGPEPEKKDRYFGFLPGNGIHEIHMNQGNSDRYVAQDGVWQDGGVLIHFPLHDQWVGLFLKFQSQTWHTDDTTGHSIGRPTPRSLISTLRGDLPGLQPYLQYLPTTDEPDGLVRIVGALVNSTKSPEEETITLINTAAHSVSIEGWCVLDTQENRMVLNGSLGAGEVRTIPIKRPVVLSNKGGVISLIDENGIKVHGVSYTREQARNPGWTIVF